MRSIQNWIGKCERTFCPWISPNAVISFSQPLECSIQVFCYCSSSRLNFESTSNKTSTKNHNIVHAHSWSPKYLTKLCSTEYTIRISEQHIFRHNSGLKAPWHQQKRRNDPIAAFANSQNIWFIFAQQKYLSFCAVLPSPYFRSSPPTATCKAQVRTPQYKRTKQRAMAILKSASWSDLFWLLFRTTPFFIDTPHSYSSTVLSHLVTSSRQNLNCFETWDPYLFSFSDLDDLPEVRKCAQKSWDIMNSWLVKRY